VSVYRGHKPDISLYQEAADCLDRIVSVPVYVVTDGHKTVQRSKLQALGLYDRVKFCFITYRYGIKNSKPSPYCFLKICAREKTTPDKVVYVGDNPHKDFVGIKPYGFKTIRVLTGQYSEVQESSEFEAHIKVSSLAGVNMELLRQLTGEH
jgi:putative hydrolase of the HAD superfamily